MVTEIHCVDLQSILDVLGLRLRVAAAQKLSSDIQDLAGWVFLFISAGEAALADDRSTLN